MGPGTDAHHLRPADITVNSARNNRWFDNCSEPYIDGDGQSGSFTSTTRWVWQPRDKVKGDVARMIFYMATRYEGENGEPDLEVIDYIPEDQNTNDPIHAKLSALLQWHQQDPVDDYERTRNNVIYQYQDNRNPFIDHPGYVNMIWSDESSSEKLIYNNRIIIFPNPASDHTFIKLDSYSDYYQVIIIDQLGCIVFNAYAKGPLYKINLPSGVDKGLYYLQVINPKGADIKTIMMIIQ